MINCTAIHNYVITSAWNAELKLKKKSTFQNEPYRLGFVFYRSFPISKAASCCRTARKNVKVTPWEFVSYACLAEKKCNLFTASSTMYFFSSQQAIRTSINSIFFMHRTLELANQAINSHQHWCLEECCFRINADFLPQSTPIPVLSCLSLTSELLWF